MRVTKRGQTGLPPRGSGDPDQGQGAGRKSIAWRAAPWVLAALVLLPGYAPAEGGATLAALEASWHRENEARDHYLVYALYAEQEGFPQIAFLFRVAAKAESVHAARLGTRIETLGGRMTPKRTSVVVRSTAENLRTSIDLERWERNAVYPRFAQYAREECLYDEVATFNFVGTAEETHAALFAAGLAWLERDKLALLDPRQFAWEVDPPTPTGPKVYLCPGDGSVFTAPMVGRCPNCGTRAAGAIVLACPGPVDRPPAQPTSKPLAAR